MVRDSVLYDRLSAGLREITVKAIKESRKRQIDPAVKKEIAKISALLLLQAKAMQSPCTTKQLEKLREMLRRAGCSAALLHKIADMQVFVELLPKLRALQHFLLCYKRAAHCLSYFTYLLLENSMLGEAIARVQDTITLERNTSERLKVLVSALAFFLQLKPDIIIELNNAISSSQDLMESLKRAVELVGIPSLLLDFKTTLSEQKLQKIVQSKKMIDPLLANELHELVEQTKTYEELLFAYIFALKPETSSFFFRMSLYDLIGSLGKDRFSRVVRFALDFVVDKILNEELDRQAVLSSALELARSVLQEIDAQIRAPPASMLGFALLVASCKLASKLSELAAAALNNSCLPKKAQRLVKLLLSVKAKDLLDEEPAVLLETAFPELKDLGLKLAWIEKGAVELRQ